MLSRKLFVFCATFAQACETESKIQQAQSDTATEGYALQAVPPAPTEEECRVALDALGVTHDWLGFHRHIVAPVRILDAGPGIPLRYRSAPVGTDAAREGYLLGPRDTSCYTAVSLARAMRDLEYSVTELVHVGSYNCRNIDGTIPSLCTDGTVISNPDFVPPPSLSDHAWALAFDVDGIVVGGQYYNMPRDRNSPEIRALYRVLREHFSHVLPTDINNPDSYHRDHIHAGEPRYSETTTPWLDCGDGEVADYEDNDGDGAVDETCRVRLNRLYWSNGHGCFWPWHNWDHCFSVDGVNCIGGNQGGGEGYVTDGFSLAIYPLEIGRGAETMQVGPHTFARLESCYHEEASWHVYATFDSVEYRDLSANPDWTCVSVGYVRTGSGIAGATPVYAIQIDSATTRAYTTDPNEADRLPAAGCSFTQAVAWYGWTPVEAEITISAAFESMKDEGEGEAEPVCGDGECNDSETCSTCSADCGDCCGDGSCNGDEDCASCPGDCGGCSSEVCDGIDNDSDGRVDESLARGCRTACGTGTETCMNGVWCDCTAPLPFFEICNGLDDDCDGTVDEDCYDIEDEGLSYPPRCPENNRIRNPGFEGPLYEWPQDHWREDGEGARLVRDCEVSYEGSCSGQLTGCSGSGGDPQVAQSGIPTIAGLNEICFCARANVPTEVSIFVARMYVDGSTTFVDSVRVLEGWRCFCAEHELEAEDVLRFSFDGGSTRTVWFDAVHLGECAPEEPCESCGEFCGDGECNGEETCSTCSADCGECSPFCGDWECTGDEDCSTCSADCDPCPPEICDGLDNDLDGLVDESLTRSCSTACGSGTEICVSGAWQDCTAPAPVAEVCDGRDNDCDGTVDEGVQNACGTCGSVPSEICDGADNDCDGLTDENQGSSTCGLGVCEHTQQNCVGGALIACDPLAGSADETCDGTLDEDCDGTVDEDCECVNGTEQDCSTLPCGNLGTQTCTDGVWDVCDGPACPPPVVCGDDACTGDETCRNCPADCGQCCGDGTCARFETCSICPEDCGICPPVCGDRECNGDETCRTCPTDCGPCCGNGTCGSGETCSSCPSDCGECPCVPDWTCGDWSCSCSGTRTRTCTDRNDCGTTAGRPATVGTCHRCGNGACDCSETCRSCPLDCDPCPPEICDGLDNDLDGLVDESLTRSCSTACGSGTEICVSGAWQDCTAPAPSAEVCDGRDNDCDGTVDEGVQNACGTCGSVPSEICDGADNDCDGLTDENQGSSTCGLGVCEHTQQNCVGGAPITCDPFAGFSDETCDGILDENCNGAVDEGCECVNGAEQECAIDPCGNLGTQTCTDGTWSGCDALVCPFCGDGECNGEETCSTCSADCGECSPFCGDWECNGDETCTSCASDCGECPPPSNELRIRCFSDRLIELDRQELSGTIRNPDGSEWGWSRLTLLENSDQPIEARLTLPPGYSWRGSDEFQEGAEIWWICVGTNPSNSVLRGVCTAQWNGLLLDVRRFYDGAGCGIIVEAPEDGRGSVSGCGDGACEGVENCSSCPADCGVCAADRGTLRFYFETPGGRTASRICLSYNLNGLPPWFGSVCCRDNTDSITCDTSVVSGERANYSFAFWIGGVESWSCLGIGSGARMNGTARVTWIPDEGGSRELPSTVYSSGSGCNLEVVTP